MSELDNFMQLFQGRTDVYGSVEGRSNKEPVTPELYKQHFEGKKSLGIYPLQDDGTIRFFAVDLDEKNWDKALLIRNELVNIGVPIYICESKSKGFHIYGFASEPLIAKDVREVLVGTLMKLNITCEVFPKQDKLDEIIKYGNYINLPVYGNTRQFQDVNHQPVPFATAFSLIQYNTQASILTAKAKVPPIPPPMLPVKPEKDKEKKSETKKGKSPPCVLRILKGVDSGMRDEAAFALARHYLDQGDLPEEVLAMLLIWDAKNRPPMADMKIIQTKVQSAEHGYAFGCNSIQEGILSGFCVGKQNCEYLKRAIHEKKEAGLIKETSWFETDHYIYEQVATITRMHDIKDAMFLRYDKRSGEIIPVKEFLDGEITYWPIMSEELGYKSVTLSSAIEEYDTTEQLVEDLKKHINKYCDLPEKFREFAAWYVLMTWVYHRLPSMVYLRFLGDYGTGKSRSLDIVGGLCYKRMRLGGAVTTAPLYRMMKKYEGSLIIDEADFDKSDTTHEVVKILNSGIEPGSPIMRCSKDDPDNMQTFPCFGPKAFATRMRFQDDALESRCLTAVMEESDRTDIPSYLAKEHNEAQQHLRNKLLLWRFRNLTRIPEEISETTDIDLGKIESRLKQVCLPFAMIFADLPETLDRFKRFLQGYSKELRAAREDSIQSRLVYAMFKAAVVMGKDYTTIGSVGKIAADELKLDIKENTISKYLHNMKIETQRMRIQSPDGTKVTRPSVIKWDSHLMAKLYRRYLNDLTPTPEKDSEENQFLTMLGFLPGDGLGTPIKDPIRPEN